MDKQLSHISNTSPRATESHSKSFALFSFDYNITPHLLNSINVNLPYATKAMMSVANFISSHELTHNWVP